MFNIVRVDFPFTDDPYISKARPALCLTCPHGKRQLVILAFMTSKRSDRLDTDVILDEKDPDFSVLNLKKTTIIQPHRLISVSAKCIKEQSSPISPKKNKEVQKSLCKLFGLKHHA